MTAALFVEAITTVRTLGWAALVWFVLLAVAASLAVYAVVVAVACAWRAISRGVVAVRSAVQASRAPALLPESPEAPEAPQRPAPSWAHTQPTETEEAA